MRTLIPWRRRNGGLLEPFRQEMEEVFDRFFREPFEPAVTAIQEWAPRVDIEEKEKEIVVKADLPGVDAKDVEVSVVDGALVLQGEKKEEREERNKNLHRVERFVGKFYRELPLPPGTDPTRISATSSKGVVTITVPKKPEVLPQKIAVKPQD